VSWWSRLRNTVRDDRLIDEVDEELASHLAEAAARGRDPREARRALGGSLQYREASRDVRRIAWIGDFVADLRYAARQLRRQPAFFAIAVLSLAVGIGANSAIFTVIDVLNLRPLPVNHPEQLVAFRVDDGTIKADYWYYELGYPNYLAIRDRTNVFSDVAAIGLLDRYGITIDGATDPAAARVTLVSGNYFRMYGVNAAVGRALTVDDDQHPGAEPVAVISDRYWTSRFARARDIVGRTFGLSGTTYTILGVMPPAFTGDWIGRPSDVWIPIMMQSEVMTEMPGFLTRGNGWMRMVGRLKPGVSMQQAEAAAGVVWHQLQMELAGPNATPQRLQEIESDRHSLVSAASGYSAQRTAFGSPLRILTAGVGLVLLIACANVAGLLTVRATGRRREMAVRLSLGAGRGRIIRQLLTEGALLAACGGLLGLPLAFWGATALSRVPLVPVQVDARAGSSWTSYDMRPDPRVFAFTAVTCLLACVFVALAPALRGSRVGLVAGLTGRGIDSDRRRRRLDLGRALVVTEVALAFVLVIGAGLLVRTLANLRAVDLGFESHHVLLVTTSPGQTGRAGPALIPYSRLILDRLSTLPGIRSVSASNGGLLDGIGGSSTGTLTILGRPPRAGESWSRRLVMPGYFATLGLPLVAGRDFTPADTADRPRVEVINETFARVFFGDENPIGQRFYEGGDHGAVGQVIGIVKDTKYNTPRDPPRTYLYGSALQDAGFLRNMQIAVRVADPPSAMAGLVRQELQRIDPRLPVLKVDTIDERVDDTVAPERLTAGVTTVLGSVATAMACLGLYGILSYAVSRRIPELGVRMALGATRRDVLLLVAAESAGLTGVGLAIGALVALAVMRVTSSLLFGVSAFDPPTFALAAVLIVSMAIVASLVPAWRASRTDPMRALRCE
jgi:predicted permease